VSLKSAHVRDCGPVLGVGGLLTDERTALNGFAHVEFASTEEALRAARQGSPHGFRYADRLLDVDFARWIFYIGPAYRVVYISGWNTSHGRNGLLQWTYDIPNIVGARVCTSLTLSDFYPLTLCHVITVPPFRGEELSDLRSAFLEFGRIDDARTAVRMLDGRAGPGGETLHVGLSRLPAVHTDRRWRWTYEVQEKEKGGGVKEGEEDFEDEWEGLGFGTGREEEGAQGVGRRSHGRGHRDPLKWER
jgi:hypothetical protein